jgi:P27 family predicted phage terminase small subunit
MTKKIAPPKHLSAEAKKIWRGIISEYDIDDIAGLKILRVALEAYDRAEKCRTMIEKHGMMLKDRFGAPKSHPLLPVERDNRAAFLAGLKALNLDILPLRDGPGRPGGQ